jgi:uncharacterized protein (TIGR03435 family)
MFRVFTVCLGLQVVSALAQTPATFEVVTIKPATLDMANLAAGMRSGQMPRIGPHISATRAEYICLSLKDLITLAYKVKPYQISGPDWIGTQRFDIVAKLPEGASKDDVPKMLAALLEERFKLVLHRESKVHPVLALVVGKGGPTMNESLEPATPIDENAPLQPGEMKTDSAEGPIRTTIGRNGGATVNMGSRGVMSYKVDPATRTVRMEAKGVTMSGFADMLNQFSRITGGGERTIVDMTGLTGRYQVALGLSLADSMNTARAPGAKIPSPVGGGKAQDSPADAASDPGSPSLFSAVQRLGLKIERREAVVEQLVIDGVEKVPTEN